MLYGRREERALITSRLAGTRGRRCGVLALAVSTALLWPATAAASATAGHLVGHPAAAMSPAGQQVVVLGRGPGRGLLLTRRDDHRRYGPILFGMLEVALGAILLLAAAWRRSQPRRGRRGQPASVGARAPPILPIPLT